MTPEISLTLLPAATIQICVTTTNEAAFLSKAINPLPMNKNPLSFVLSSRVQVLLPLLPQFP
jgi:hypothetical protein